MQSALAMVLAVASIIGGGSLVMGLTGGLGEGWGTGGPGHGCQGMDGGYTNGMHDYCEKEMAEHGWNATHGPCQNGTYDNDDAGK